MKAIRLTFPLLVVLSALGHGSVARATGDPRPPNQVIIFSEDQGYANVGCFGSPEIRRPRLDADAAFREAFDDAVDESVEREGQDRKQR